MLSTCKLLSDFNQIWSILDIFVQVHDMKFHGNPSSGSRTDTERWTDVKLMWALRGYERVSYEVVVLHCVSYFCLIIYR